MRFNGLRAENGTFYSKHCDASIFFNKKQSMNEADHSLVSNTDKSSSERSQVSRYTMVNSDCNDAIVILRAKPQQKKK